MKYSRILSLVPIKWCYRNNRLHNLRKKDAKTMFDSTLWALLISQCFMWFGSHFTVGVTGRVLLSSRVSSLVINLLIMSPHRKTASISVSSSCMTPWNVLRYRRHAGPLSLRTTADSSIGKTKQVRFYLLFNFHLQFTNKSVGSLCSYLPTEKTLLYVSTQKEDLRQNE